MIETEYYRGFMGHIQIWLQSNYKGAVEILI